VQNSAEFWTTLDFDRDLRNRLEYRSSENLCIDSDSFCVLEKSRVNFGPLTTKFKACILTHPTYTILERPHSSNFLQALKIMWKPEFSNNFAQ